MDILSWLWWPVSLLLSLVWFLIGGWISALIQIFVLALGIFVFKYGWQQGPIEFWRSFEGARRFVWGWLKGGRAERNAAATATASAQDVRRGEIQVVHVRDWGDINVSTLLSLIMLGGLWLLRAIQ